MRVKLLSRCAGPEGNFAPGERVIEVSDKAALQLVVNRQAIYTLKPPTEIKEAEGSDEKD